MLEKIAENKQTPKEITTKKLITLMKASGDFFDKWYCENELSELGESSDKLISQVCESITVNG